MSIEEKVEYMRGLIADFKYKDERGLLSEEEKIEYKTVSRYMEGFQDGYQYSLTGTPEDQKEKKDLKLELKEAYDKIAELEAKLNGAN